MNQQSHIRTYHYLRCNPINTYFQETGDIVVQQLFSDSELCYSQEKCDNVCYRINYLCNLIEEIEQRNPYTKGREGITLEILHTMYDYILQGRGTVILCASSLKYLNDLCAVYKGATVKKV